MRTPNEKFILDTFVIACKYLQHNPPSEISTLEEMNACYGCDTYEDGWKQWANYFINQALKINGETEITKGGSEYDDTK